MSGHLSFELRPLAGDAGDLLEVRRVLELAPDCANAIQGAPVDPLEAVRTFTELPPGVDPSAKTVFGVYADDEPVGVIDLVEGFPVPTTAMLGLLLVAGTHRRRGIGTRAVRAVEDLILSWGTCDRVRIGVVRTNAPALAFWEAVGYSATGELRPYEGGAVRSEIVVMEKRIDRAAGGMPGKRIDLTTGKRAAEEKRGVAGRASCIGTQRECALRAGPTCQPAPPP